MFGHSAITPFLGGYTNGEICPAPPYTVVRNSYVFYCMVYVIYSHTLYTCVYTNRIVDSARAYTVVSKSYVFYCMVFCVYSHTLYTCVYTNRQVHPAPPDTVVRKSYVSTAWYSLYIRTRYTFVSTPIDKFILPPPIQL